MAEQVLVAEGLVKDYGAFRALHGVSLSVERGESYGFIGPNGAGKSTTIRCLLDLLRPTAGSHRLLGADDIAGRPDLRARIGYLPGELSLGGRQTARQHLTYLCGLRGGAGLVRIEPLAERFRLDLDRPFRGLSKGNKQKVGVVQAFMHAPELLILDEPTSGLDPLLQQEFLTLAREANEAGATLFISSHILSEVEAIAGRVAIIRAGRIVDVADVADLRTRAGQHVSLTFAQPPPVAAFEALAIGNGSKILAGHEEDGELELELTSPLPRSAIYAQRLAALWAQITVVVGVVSLAILVIDAAEGLAIPRGDLAAATLQLWLLVGFFGSLAFGIGAATGRRGIALGAAAGFAVVSWMFNAIGPTIKQDWMASVSPIGWYMADNPVTRGFQPVDVLLLLAASAVAICVGWFGFGRRDLMA